MKVYTDEMRICDSWVTYEAAVIWRNDDIAVYEDRGMSPGAIMAHSFVGGVVMKRSAVRPN